MIRQKRRILLICPFKECTCHLSAVSAEALHLTADFPVTSSQTNTPAGIDFFPSMQVSGLSAVSQPDGAKVPRKKKKSTKSVETFNLQQWILGFLQQKETFCALALDGKRLL